MKVTMISYDVDLQVIREKLYDSIHPKYRNYTTPQIHPNIIQLTREETEALIQLIETQQHVEAYQQTHPQHTHKQSNRIEI